MKQESLNVEYKSEYVEDIKKTVVAFANTSGGKLYIGISDSGEAIGLENPDGVMLKVANTIRDSVKPDVTLFSTCSRDIIDGKNVVVITVQKGTACPYYLTGKGIRPEGVYVRQGSSSVPATEAAILKMIKETSGDNYEEIRSLNQELTFDYCKKEFSGANIKIEQSQMKTLGLIGGDNLFTNLGLLLSDQCVHTIKLAVFEGATKQIFKDRYEFKGSLLQQLRECYALIDRYNRTRAEFEGLNRIDMRDYPQVAIRESLLNTIVHRDYSFSGSTLISIFDDRVEFVTIGGLVRGMSQSDMLLGVSILRNKNLANVFYRLQLIEAFGTGIPKIMESYEDCPVSPKIEISDNAFKITLSSILYKPHSTDKYSIAEPIYTEGEQKVLDIFITKDTITRRDIEAAVSVSQPMAVKHLKSLLNKEAIVKIGTGKNTKYRLK